MKKLVYMLSIVTVAIVMLSANNLNAGIADSHLFSATEDLIVSTDGGDTDLYLDCFENAVKAKDMELAAKIANVLYGMNMNEAQQKRFSKIEDMISKKDYRVYRDNLRYFSSKSSTVQDDGYYDFYVEPYGEQGSTDFGSDDDSAFVDEMIDAFASFFNDLGAADSSSYHYERHDTLGDGGFVDVFVDTFGKYWFDDGSDGEMQQKRSNSRAEIDALLDDYENYVGLSVDALRRVISGDESAVKDFEKFSEKASTASEKISRQSNEMTSAQFKRYLHILGNMVTGMF
ncbi:MAG: hypothetical protein J5542_08570 [Bacteroidales bacterium]|nr:hypothetical protein [Bacteroidales bacterium]